MKIWFRVYKTSNVLKQLKIKRKLVINGLSIETKMYDLEMNSERD